jgi:hypothetical protein
MTALKPAGGLAVMAGRREPADSLDFFPTPPWATRALFEYVIGHRLAADRCWEPACGEGHMADVLREEFRSVIASDVHDYGVGARVGSFVGAGPDVMTSPGPVDWIITNPPFTLAVEFAERALAEDVTGVALLVRTSWLEGGDRYRRLFERRPPIRIAQFAERVPMVKGRWDPQASTATSYCWVVWRPSTSDGTTRFVWIPPGCRERLTRPDDVARFTRPTP